MKKLVLLRTKHPMLNDIVWVPVVGMALAMLLFVAFFVTMFIAGIVDLYHEHRDRVWSELKRDHKQPRRPAAK